MARTTKSTGEYAKTYRKESSGKVVYLDQKCWINLAKIFFGFIEKACTIADYKFLNNDEFAK
jgi:hypothetical protein